MKNLFYIYLFLITINSYSQNKSSIIKEVKSFQYETYSNSLYYTSDDTLKWVIYEYFKEKDYTLKQQRDSSYFYVYTKKFPHPQIKNRLVESFIYVDILPRGLLKKINIDIEEINHVRPFARTPNPKNNNSINTHYFDKRAFYKYLYTFFNKDKMNYPKELIDKINTYNLKQKKEKKKIIEGKDY